MDAGVGLPPGFATVADEATAAFGFVLTLVVPASTGGGGGTGLVVSVTSVFAAEKPPSLEP